MMILITEGIRDRIQAVKQYAAQNIRKIDFDKIVIPGDDDNHVVNFANGLRVVYSIDVIEGTLPVSHHFSISVNKKYRVISPGIAKIIIEAYGIETEYYDFAFKEGLGNGYFAVNIIIKMDSPP